MAPNNSTRKRGYVGCVKTGANSARIEAASAGTMFIGPSLARRLVWCGNLPIYCQGGLFVCTSWAHRSLKKVQKSSLEPIRKRGQAPLCEAPFGPYRQRGMTPFPDRL